MKMKKMKTWNISRSDLSKLIEVKYKCFSNESDGIKMPGSEHEMMKMLWSDLSKLISRSLYSWLYGLDVPLHLLFRRSLWTIQCIGRP